MAISNKSAKNANAKTTTNPDEHDGISHLTLKSYNNSSRAQIIIQII